MNKYAFIALTSENQKIKGVIEAQNEQELRRIINYHHYYLIKSKIIKNHRNIFFPQTISRKMLSSLCQNLNMMLKTGMKIMQAIKTIQNSTRNSKLIKILTEIEQEMLNGKTLSTCLQKYPKCFPKMMIQMIGIGEKTDTLEETFYYLAQYYEEENIIRNKIINALFYPSILLLMTFVVITILSIFVLPMYNNIFQSNNVQLPLITSILLQLSHFCNQHFLLLMTISVSLICLVFLFCRTKLGKKMIDHFLLKSVVTRKMMNTFYTYQVSSCLSIMINSGMSIVHSVETMISVLSGGYLKNKFRIIIDEIKRGQKLSQAMESANYFPSLLIEMIKVGEVAGNVKFGLVNCNKYYFVNLKNYFNKISTLVEPLLIVLISMVVGAIMIAVFLPMLSLMSSLV